MDAGTQAWKGGGLGRMGRYIGVYGGHRGHIAYDIGVYRGI